MRLIKNIEKNDIGSITILATTITNNDGGIAVKAGDFAIGPEIELVS